MIGRCGDEERRGDKGDKGEGNDAVYSNLNTQTRLPVSPFVVTVVDSIHRLCTPPPSATRSAHTHAHTHTHTHTLYSY